METNREKKTEIEGRERWGCICVCGGGEGGGRGLPEKYCAESNKNIDSMKTV